jgi:hypothetical protein
MYCTVKYIVLLGHIKKRTLLRKIFVVLVQFPYEIADKTLVFEFCDV